MLERVIIRQATVHDVANKRIVKQHGHLAVSTRQYPRYLKKGSAHEWLPALGPAPALLRSFRDLEAELGDHDAAFEGCRYEERFALGDDGLAALKALAEISHTTPVYLICHCAIGRYCHRELLMLMAEAMHGARIGAVSKPYERFRARLDATGLRPPASDAEPGAR